ncbi:sulfur carrier protein ThiS [Sporosarcina sp. FSL K6-6792]|uniref:sulfur carrier protein ThiS n=1 Tax=Sporosarcina sp. FSL K6-6792 TaxID=2921559 RepID=UPI0030F6C49F
MKRTIELNGNRYDMPAEVKNVQELLGHLELAERIVIVELNRDILAKDAYDKPINDRDQIEIIHFVGGG